MCSAGCYLSIPSHLGLNDLDFGGFYQKKHDIALLEARFESFRAFCPFEVNEGPLRTLNQYFLICMCSSSCYSSIPCHIGLNNLDVSGYKKI
jgi:hypothetical protein